MFNSNSGFHTPGNSESRTVNFHEISSRQFVVMTQSNQMTLIHNNRTIKFGNLCTTTYRISIAIARKNHIQQHRCCRSRAYIDNHIKRLWFFSHMRMLLTCSRKLARKTENHTLRNSCSAQLSTKGVKGRHRTTTSSLSAGSFDLNKACFRHCDWTDKFKHATHEGSTVYEVYRVTCVTHWCVRIAVTRCHTVIIVIFRQWRW